MNTTTNTVVSTSTTIAVLADNSKLADVVAKVNELVAKHNELVEKFTSRNGPISERKMTEDDAKRIMIGDLKDVPHGKVAEQLNLSYGQIYSARKGFTFKPIYQEMIKAQAATAK